MKTALTTTVLGGVLTAAAASGRPTMTLLGVLLLALVILACWIITNRDRTANTVAILTAIRGQRTDPDQPRSHRRTMSPTTEVLWRSTDGDTSGTPSWDSTTCLGFDSRSRSVPPADPSEAPQSGA